MKRPFTSATFALLGGLGAVVSCDYDSGGTFPELGVFASIEGDPLRPVLCAPLPLLQGSQVDVRRALDDALEVSAEATRKGVTLRFFAGSDEVAPSLYVEREDLLNTFVETKRIERNGTTYDLRFVPNCTDPSGSVGSGGTGGGTGGRPGTGGSGKGGAGGASGGSSGSGGLGTGARAPVSAVVDSFSPEEGPYGTIVTIRGRNLQTTELSDLRISINEQDRVVFGPDATNVLAWEDDTIRFRYPFPADGPMHVDQNTFPRVDVGTFVATWMPGKRHVLPGTTTAITAISDGPGRILAVLDTTPPALVSADGSNWTRQALTFESLRADTIRLYRASDGIRGFALSTTDPPQILALERRVGDGGAPLLAQEIPDGGAPGTPDGGVVSSDGGADAGPGPDVDIIPGEAFDAIPTGVVVSSTFVLAGGDAGAAVWFQDGAGWRRARPGVGRWVIDKGPIADPNPSASLHTAVATSDGALHVLWAEATGSTFDDTGTPYVQSLPSAASTFGTPAPAGDAVDDFLTTLVAESRGDGFVVRYCGSDVDNFGFSGSEYRCRLVLRRADGQSVQGTWKDDELSRHAISGNTIGGLRCDTAAGQSFVPDAIAGSGEKLAIWPCSPVVAIAVDPDGVTQFILRAGSGIYSPRAR